VPQPPAPSADAAPTDGSPGGAAFVVLAGGSGSRVGATLDGAPANKAFLPLAGRAAVCWSLAVAAGLPEVGVLMLVARREDLGLAREVLARDLPGLDVEVVPGGSSRHGSEQAALDALAGRVADARVRLVAIHDGARPVLTADLVRRVLAEADRVGGALPVVPSEGLLRADGDRLLPGGGRDLVRVQTPQAFRAVELVAAYAAAAAAGREGTDTASTVEAFGGVPVAAVPGSPTNLKITYPEDVAAAERLLGAAG
jgi:2-C-methyl-D-erythritol 4-phosphate cytidylyltransferase